MKKYLHYAMLLLLTSAQVQAQKALAKLEEKHSDFFQKHPNEKVYLQCDKPLYLLGEGIWFTAFVREGQHLQATETSDALRVELLNPKGEIEKELKLLVRDGVAKGDFTLPKSLYPGIYKLRAYTWYMKNDPNPAIFEREIQVQNAVSPRLTASIYFDKDVYSASSEVKARLQLQDTEKGLLRNQNFKFNIQIDGKEVLSEKGTSGAEGKSEIAFHLPATLSKSGTILNVNWEYEGKTEQISRTIPITLNQVALSFFPEGGDMIAGMKNQVAFRAQNEWGKGVEVEGYIADKQGNKVTDFHSFHQGMGSFSFVPDARRSYVAHLAKPQIAVFDLPQSQAEGYVLSLQKQEKNALKVQIQCLEKGKVSLVLAVHEKIYWDTTFVALKGENTLMIPSTQLPIGIAQITLLDAKAIPQAERLAFLHAEKQMNIALSFANEKQSFNNREKITLNISTKDEANQPVAAHLGLAVVNDKLRDFAQDKSANVLASLLLESELKSTIENPNFYFDPNENAEKRAIALDNLLMTAGWRRYTWKEVVHVQTPKVLYETEALARKNVEGIVYGYDKKTPLAGAKIQVEGLPLAIYSNAKGEFTIPQQRLDLTVLTQLRISKDDMEFCYYLPTYSDVSNPLAVFPTSPYKDKLSGQTEIKGTWVSGKVSEKDGSSSSYSTLTFFQKNKAITGGNADENGAFNIENVQAGIYDIHIENTERGLWLRNYVIPSDSVYHLNVQFGKQNTLTKTIVKKAESAPQIPFHSSENNYFVEANAKESIIIEEEQIEEEALLASAEETGENSGQMGIVQITAFKMPLYDPKDIAIKTGFTAKDIKNAPNRDIASIVGKAPGVYQGDEGDQSLSIRAARPTSNVYIVDGVKIVGSNNIPKSAIAKVEVYMGGTPAEFGDFTGGVIVIETATESNNPNKFVASSAQNGDVIQFGNKAMIENIAAPTKNFYRAKEFAAPSYESHTFTTKENDFRQTLYWNGNVMTDASGKASIDFYTSDEEANFSIIVEGLGIKGEIGRKELLFSVEKKRK